MTGIRLEKTTVPIIASLRSYRPVVQTRRTEKYWYAKEENDSYERRYWHKEEDDGDKIGENYKRRRQQGERDKRKKPRTSLEEQKEDESHAGSRGQKQDSTCVYTRVVTSSFSSSDSSSDDDAQDRGIPSDEDTTIVWLKTSIEEKGIYM